MMDIGNAAGDRILDRDHAKIGFARIYRGQRILESRAGQGFGLRIGLGDGDVGVRPRFALEDNFLQSGHRFRSWRAARARVVAAAQFLESIRRAVSRSGGVSTPRGTVSTMLMSIRMPASSARNCSSFS